MRRILLCAAMVVAACGDNSNECDPGTTMNVDGRCVGNATTCSDGTILVEDHCEVDPAACQDGTVLMGGKCVDPAHVAADIEEAAEPNGLGLIESSADPAGTIMLKPVGEHFVIHGKIIPFQDDDADGQQDADIDTYILEVTAPTMISITADGVHGLAAGFVSVAAVGANDPLVDWTRFGVNLTGDTSKRQLFLPVAGTYAIGIGDSRTLLLSSSAAGAPTGAPSFEYYVTVDAVAATPMVLTVGGNGVATATGMRSPGEVKLFTAPMGEGFNDASLESPALQISSSLVVTRTRASAVSIRGLADGDPAGVAFLGIKTGDTTTFVADTVIDYANSPTPFTLTINSKGAGALSTTGADTTQPGDDVDFTTYYYDVASDGLLVGMDLSFDIPVAGVIIDEDAFIFSAFTFVPGFGFFGDFQQYTGLLNHAKPGRYYFLTFDPGGVATDITATSTYNAVTATPIVKGTPMSNVTVNGFASNAFAYAAGTMTDPWQSFTGSGTGSGTITAAFFDPATTVGRLDFLDSTCGFCDDSPLPLFTQDYDEAGETHGRILLAQANLASYFVKVNTATATGSFTLDYKVQANVTDLGTGMVGTPLTAMNVDIDTTSHAVQRFLVRTAAGSKLDISVSPDGAGLDTGFQPLNADESAKGAAVDNGGAGAPDSATLLQDASGFTAFTVTQSTAVADTFDVSVTTIPPPYTTSAGATAFSDACTGGMAVTLSNTDEGASGLIDTPTGFDFFGSPAPQLRVFTNGFLTFDTALACTTVGSNCFFGNSSLPSASNPNAMVGPYWDDLDVVAVCQKTVGSTLIIQWTGVLFLSSTTVSFQAILDGSNDKIEFIYGPTHAATGSSATIGLEDQGGTAAIQLSSNTVNQSPNTIFTPM